MVRQKVNRVSCSEAEPQVEQVGEGRGASLGWMGETLEQLKLEEHRLLLEVDEQN